MKQDDAQTIKKTMQAIKELEEFAKWRLEKISKKINKDGSNLEIELKKIKVKDWKNEKSRVVETISIRQKLEDEVRRWREEELKCVN